MAARRRYPRYPRERPLPVSVQRSATSAEQGPSVGPPAPSSTQQRAEARAFPHRVLLAWPKTHKAKPERDGTAQAMFSRRPASFVTPKQLTAETAAAAAAMAAAVEPPPRASTPTPAAALSRGCVRGWATSLRLGRVQVPPFQGPGGVQRATDGALEGALATSPVRSESLHSLRRVVAEVGRPGWV